MKAIIEPLFPIPVYFSNLEREFSKQEKNLIAKCKKRTFRNKGNASSTDTYLLETKPFKKLKKELFLRVQHYFDTVLCYKNVTPYITQSWLSYTETAEYHHSHEHPNSIVSGVLYVNADKKNDRVTFLKQDYKQIRPQIREFNTFNSSSWWFPVQTGEIILFPSSLTHMVETKKGDNTRISLSFNVFIKGTLGTKQELIELIL